MIETETVLLPHVIADCVIGELERHLGMDFPDREALAEHLCSKAERCYQSKPQLSSSFYRRIRGCNGRDYLYMFMRHWLAAESVRRYGLAGRIPACFANGLPIQQRRGNGLGSKNPDNLQRP